MSLSTPLRPALPNRHFRDIPIVLSVYLGWKYLKKTRIVSLKQIPILAALDAADER